MKKRMLIAPVLLGVLLAGCGNKDDTNATKEKQYDFCVEVKDKDSLKLSTDSTFKDLESKLGVEEVPSFASAFTYGWFLNSSKGYTFDKIHSEETDYKLGFSSVNGGMGFFKYTFFIKNKGESNTSYNMDIQLEKSLFDKQSEIYEYLRLMVFEGDKTPTIYAHRSKTRYDYSHEIYHEYVSGPEGTSYYYGEAELFESDTLLASISSSLHVNESRMITLLFWLEGEDADCKDMPDEAYLNIKVSIE